MSWQDINGILGTVTGVLGLGASVWAARAAQSAAERARETRDALQQYYLQDSLAKAVGHARQLVEAMREMKWDRALSKLDELRPEMNRVSFQYGAHLTEESTKSIAAAFEAVVEMEARLEQAGDSPPTEEEAALLRQSCASIRNTLEQEHGKSTAQPAAIERLMQ